MIQRRHFFCLPAATTWGEFLYGSRIALQLQRRGDAIVFAAPQSMRPVLERMPFRFIPFGAPAEVLPDLAGLARRERCDTGVLVDVALTYVHLERLGLAEAFAASWDVPLLGLDVWDLKRSSMLWDFGPSGWSLSPHCHDVARTLLPTPVLAATGATTYNSLPEDLPAAGAREAVRAQMGLKSGEKVVFFPSAAWQQGGEQHLRFPQRLAAAMPDVIADVVGRLGARLLHVGPVAMPEVAARLGAAYKWIPQVQRQAFTELLAASDLLLSFNAFASTIAHAMVLGIPTLLGINSHAGATPDELVGRLAHAPTALMRRFLDRVAPLHPFLMWPLGFFGFGQHILAHNPYFDALTVCEILDDEQLVAAADRLLHDPETRARADATRAAYVAAVRALPSAPELVDRLLA